VERERSANEKSEHTRIAGIVAVRISGGWGFDSKGREQRQGQTKTGRYSHVGEATSAPRYRSPAIPRVERERSADEKSEHMRIRGRVAVRNSGDGNSTWREGKRDKLEDRRVQPGWQGNEHSEVPVPGSSEGGNERAVQRIKKTKENKERKKERTGRERNPKTVGARISGDGDQGDGGGG
jgi:hypothetical protein